MRRAWLQKHPTPEAQGGEFHWFTPDARDGDRDLCTSFAERLAGASVPVVLWHHAPGCVAWARAFATTAPRDGRRYVGLALAIVDGPGEPPAALLERLVVPEAAPWVEGDADGLRTSDFGLRPEVGRATKAIARGLIDGGVAHVGDPEREDLAAAAAAVERVLPVSVTGAVRRGAFVAGDAVCADAVAELCVAAVNAPRSRAAAAWRLLCELAGTTGRTLDQLAGEAAVPRTDWLATLHAWGRGRLATPIDELADGVALRAVAHLAADRDAFAAIADVRWRALLPADRRGELLAAVARRSGGLIHA